MKKLMLGEKANREDDRGGGRDDGGLPRYGRRQALPRAKKRVGGGMGGGDDWEECPSAFEEECPA